MSGAASGGAAGADAIEIRHCDSLAEFHHCVELERTIWGEQITVPAAIFVVAQHTGGQILGAFDGDTLIGFTLGLVGNHAGKPFLHSHMTGVLPAYQNRGVGRRLKLFQRQEALRRGISLVEWTFDPLEIRNAHLNFNLLGAVSRRFIPNCYGVTESELHGGIPTDRLIAEWWLDSPRVERVLASERSPDENGRSVAISLPADIAKIRSTDQSQAIRIQSRVREEFQGRFAEGYVATAMISRGDLVEYILEPSASISGLRLPEYRPHESEG